MNDPPTALVGFGERRFPVRVAAAVPFPYKLVLTATLRPVCPCKLDKAKARGDASRGLLLIGVFINAYGV